MSDDPPAIASGTAPAPAEVATVEQRALAWASTLPGTPPWAEFGSRSTLLLTTPPALDGAVARGAGCWLILDADLLPALPEPWRRALAVGGVRVERSRTADGLPAELVVMTAEAAARALEGVTRRSLEARWTVRHSRALHDPLHRLDALSLAAGRLPADGLEPVLRPLFGQAVSGFRALAVGEPDVASLGEAAAATARLCGVLEDGAYAPPAWLLTAVQGTRLGERLSSWFRDLTPALSGDARARRWVADAGDGVLRELTAALRPEFAGREWLRDPDGYAIKPSR